MADLALANEFVSILPHTYGVALDLVTEALKDADPDYVRLRIEITYKVSKGNGWIYQLGYRYMIAAFNEVVSS